MKTGELLRRASFAKFATFDSSQLRVLAKVGVILLAIAATFWLSSLAQTKRERATDAKQRAAWASRTVSPANESLETFVSVWGASRAAAGDSETIRWRTTDAQELSASLLAFDAVNLNARAVVRIDVKRQDGRFNVSAELAK